MADDIKLVVGVDYTQLTGLVKTVDQTKRALSLVARDFAKTGDQKLYMRSINQIVAAQKKLDASSRLSRSEIMKLGNQMRQEVQFTEELTKATQRLSATQVQSKNRMNGNNVAIQQLGYQVGDFAVQVQSGTSAFVAFSQQGAQLAGILPLIAGPLGLTMSAAIGLSAALGVAIPIIGVVGRALFEMKNDTNEVRKEVDELSNTIQNLSVVQRAVGKDFETGLTKAFEESASAVGRLLSELRAARFEAAMRPVIDSLTEMTVGIDRVDVALSTIAGFNALIKDGQTLSVVQQAALDDAKALVEQNILLALSYDDISSALDAISESDTTKGLIVSFAEALEKAGALANEVIGKQLYDALIDAAEEAGVLDEALALIEGSADSAADSAGGISRNLRYATNEALRLRDAMNAVGRASLSRQDQIAVLRSQIAAARAGTSVAGAEASTETALELSRAGATADQIAAAAVAAGQQATLVETLESTLSDLLKPDTGPKGSGATQTDPLKQLQDQLDLQEALIGKNETQVQLLNALGVGYEEAYGAGTIADLTTQIELIAEMTEEMERQKEISDMVGNSFGNALMSIVDGTKSVKDAFKSMASDIIKELYRVLVVERLVKSVSGFVGGLFPNANGNAFSGGNVIPFANGGVVGGPSYFPMSGGRTGLMGEAGPEAIMPLKRDKNGRLGVSVEGGSGSVVVNNNINVTGGSDPAAIRMEVAKLMPQITNATKSAVIDARRRGGQMKAAFG